MLCVDDVGHSLIVGGQSVCICVLHFLHTFDTLGIRVLSPCHHRLLQNIHLNKSIEVVHLPAGIFVQMVLPCYKSDSLENFHSECFTSNSTNDIDSIFLLSDIVSPDEHDIPPFVNVVIITDSSSHGIEGLFKVLIELFSESCLLLNFLGQFFRFIGMISLFLFSLLLKVPPLLFLLLEFSRKLLLPQFE